MGIFFFLSYIVWFMFMLIWSAIPVELDWQNQEIYGVSNISFGIPQFWFVIILTAVISLYPDILCKFIRKLWKPTRLDVIQEMEFPKKDFDFNQKQCVNISKLRKQFIDDILEHQDTLKHPKENKVGCKEKMEPKYIEKDMEHIPFARPSTDKTTTTQQAINQ